MFATVSKWGNSLGVRIPSRIAVSTGLADGDKVEVSETQDGSIVIKKKKKSISKLKTFGILSDYANPELIPLEKDAFAMAMEEKYGKGIDNVH